MYDIIYAGVVLCGLFGTNDNDSLGSFLQLLSKQPCLMEQSMLQKSNSLGRKDKYIHIFLFHLIYRSKVPLSG